MRTSKIILAAIVSLALQPCLAQPPIGCDPPSTRARIIINDNGSGIDTLWFGFDISARYMIDPPLCEWEIPPAPPTGVFDARFVNIPGREGLGQGTKQDYRPYEGRADIDTHKIRFSPGDVGYPVTLRWSVDRIIAICDSAVICDEFGGIIVRARMDQLDSVRVTNPVISYLLLIRYGAILHPASVTTDDRPTTFALHQNYPNPFNPKTTIIYEVGSLLVCALLMCWDERSPHWSTKSESRGCMKQNGTLETWQAVYISTNSRPENSPAQRSFCYSADPQNTKRTQSLDALRPPKRILNIRPIRTSLSPSRLPASR